MTRREFITLLHLAARSGAQQPAMLVTIQT
jgi:hypothetical protein